MVDKSKDKSKDSGSDAWEAIAAFEQILEALPNDMVALNALVRAYEMVGDQTKALTYLVSLARQMVEQGDLESVLPFLDKLKSFAEVDARAKDVVGEIEKLRQQQGGGMLAALGAVSSPGKPTTPGSPTALPDNAKVVGRVQELMKRQVNIADELSFAWQLHQGGLLTQEEYAGVAQDLAEVSTSDVTTTVSVLHVLHDRQFRNLDNVILFAARDTNTPAISLTSFDVQRDAASLLPLNFVIRCGALVFETLGADALVAVLNPYNKALRQDVQKALGRACHFYLTTPADFDATVTKIGEMDKPKPG